MWKHSLLQSLHLVKKTKNIPLHYQCWNKKNNTAVMLQPSLKFGDFIIGYYLFCSISESKLKACIRYKRQSFFHDLRSEGDVEVPKACILFNSNQGVTPVVQKSRVTCTEVYFVNYPQLTCSVTTLDTLLMNLQPQLLVSVHND